MGRKNLLQQILPSYLLVSAVSAGLAAVAFRWSELPWFVTGIIVLAAVAPFAAWISWQVARGLTLPLERLRRGTNRFARGDLNHKLPTSDVWEIAGLAETINRLAADHDAHIRNLLRQRNEREAVLASMVEGVVAVDSDERVINLNHAGAQLLGLDREQAIGRGLQEIVRNAALQRLVAGILEDHETASDEIELALPEGDRRVLHAQGSVLYDAQELPRGALVVLHDVTRIRRLENVRRDFVANVSHELRTPVTSIKGFVETLLDGAMHQPEDAERFLKIVAAQADRLNAIIEDLLVLSRIEQGPEKIEMSLEPGLVKDVLQSAIQVCQIKADEKQVQLELACEDSLTAHMNRVLLEQAVSNLIDNAIKYSPAGERILVEGLRAPTEILLRVCDSGCGIPREHLPRIFERFYRVDKARSRELGGTGLGLAIVKHIVQAHGGRATVKSTVGEGSTFCLHLPLA